MSYVSDPNNAQLLLSMVDCGFGQLHSYRWDRRWRRCCRRADRGMPAQVECGGYSRCSRHREGADNPAERAVSRGRQPEFLAEVLRVLFAPNIEGVDRILLELLLKFDL